MGMNITTEELLRQAKQNGVAKIVIFPFPSTAIADEGINENLLLETQRIEEFIPYYYIPEDLRPIPHEKGFYGGKWHWVRGIQDCSSNYEVLEDPGVNEFIQASERIDLPIIFEEDLAFTEIFVKRTKSLKLIIPHMGMLGGSPLDFLKAFAKYPNVYFDTSLAGSGVVKRFIEKIGPERIIFGSDIPFGTMKNELEKILSLKLRTNEKELVLSENLKRLIRF
jgi:predicted TIM-barrel fold metal-dependent hydrolase